ncbi:MAG TPA: hypothetical protein VF069_27650 [Streptosporangiaceae bacterium]
MTAVNEPAARDAAVDAVPAQRFGALPPGGLARAIRNAGDAVTHGPCRRM